jgi:hypothetical protein
LRRATATRGYGSMSEIGTICEFVIVSEFG